MNKVESIPAPKLKPEEVRVFIASPDSSKRIAVVNSLSEFGLGDGVEVADNWREAADFVNSQIPGEFQANIFLFDGQVDRYESAQGELQGDRLMHGLLNSYKASVSEATKSGREQVIEDGLSLAEASIIFNYNALETVAARRLGAEALLVGISDSREGALSYPAQIPLAPYDQVGRIVSEAVVLEAAQQATAA